MLLTIGPENHDACAYVCTLPEEGRAQLDILIRLGCKPHHRVLEIGCGALVAGVPIMDYLDAGNYAGIDPNTWLIESSLKVPEVRKLANEKRPEFMSRSDFRARELGHGEFDFIISHSILSHASNAQLDDFFVAAKQQLAPGGTLAASIRLAEGNAVGSPGSAKHGADFKTWQYPGVSWFQEEDVVGRAHAVGLSAHVAPELTRTIMSGNPKAIHDWVVARPTRVTFVSAFFRLPDRVVDEAEQFRRFDELASGGAPIILFLDEKFVDVVPARENVRVITMPLDQISLFREHFERNFKLPETRDPEKDTQGFLLLQNAKIRFMWSASTIDTAATHFAWIDFGVTKISAVVPPAVFALRLAKIDPPASGVFAPGCWEDYAADEATDHRVNWRFCGGFLLSDRASLPDLVESHRKQFDRLASHSLLTWEVNVWAAMERTGFPFNWYKADHDDSLIDMPKKSTRPKRAAPISPLAIIGNHTPRICLNMILGNESTIIERCLAAALPFIDTWCLACNGTDDTAAKVEAFFRERNIPGVVAHIEFKDFAQARNAALDAALKMPAWEYVLLIDADMVITGTLDKSGLTAPAYHLLQKDGKLDYPNTRLVRRDSSARYVSVTHEFVSVGGVVMLAHDGKPADPGAIESILILDLGDGGSKSDKSARDIRLLRQGLIDEPNNERYMFYLAQTYRETGRPREAIPWYRRRIEKAGWEEEVWFSFYGIAQAYKELANQLLEHARPTLLDGEIYDAEARFVKACFDAHNYRPSRGEPIKMLSQFYREKGRSDAALLLAEALSEIVHPGAELFVERDAHDFGADQEISISGFYSKIPKFRAEGYAACARLTIHPNDFARNEAQRNFTHYVKSVVELYGATIQEIDFHPEDKWAPMNPSVCIGPDGRRLVLVRTVNYKVTNGEYPTIDGSGIIKTKNYVVEMDAQWSSADLGATLVTDVSEVPRSTFPVEGFEDCRLWYSGEFYRVSATVRDLADNPSGNCEIVTARLDEQWRIRDIAAHRDYEPGKTQKNWMPIIGRPSRFLYLCDPTIVIDTSGLSTIEHARNKPPACLVDLRGGSQLIPHGDGWLCLTHEVTWRPERVYLQRFVRFDGEFRVTAVSDPFFFKHLGIEFCAGLARDGGQLVASFGVNDASAHLAFFDVAAVDRALKTL